MSIFANGERFTVEEIHQNGNAAALFGHVNGEPCLIASEWTVHKGDVCVLRNGVPKFIPMTDDVRRELTGYMLESRG